MNKKDYKKLVGLHNQLLTLCKHHIAKYEEFYLSGMYEDIADGEEEVDEDEQLCIIDTISDIYKDSVSLISDPYKGNLYISIPIDHILIPGSMDEYIKSVHDKHAEADRIEQEQRDAAADFRKAAKIKEATKLLKDEGLL